MANAQVIHGNELGAAATTISAAVTHVSERAWRHVRSAWCTLTGGHYKVLHTEPTRMALKCVACGHTTPGWEVGGLRLATRYSPRQEPLRASPRRIA